ncbi:MAG: hypothetical protein KAI40_00325 [Desulfobacterales bacterium]|nr:hypothetical protein [Desulfobacterales bacterium]
MDTKKDLSYYTQLNYDIIIREQNQLYYLLIPELSLIVESKDLNNGYKKLEEEKKLFFSDMINAKAGNNINEPNPKVIRKGSFSELMLFCIKMFLVFFVCTSLVGIIFIGTLPLANSLVSNIPRRVATSTYAFATKVNTKFANLTDEDQQKLRMQYKSLLHKIKPFIDDTIEVLAEPKSEPLESPEK